MVARALASSARRLLPSSDGAPFTAQPSVGVRSPPRPRRRPRPGRRARPAPPGRHGRPVASPPPDRGSRTGTISASPALVTPPPSTTSSGSNMFTIDVRPTPSASTVSLPHPRGQRRRRPPRAPRTSAAVSSSTAASVLHAVEQTRRPARRSTCRTRTPRDSPGRRSPGTARPAPVDHHVSQLGAIAGRAAVEPAVEHRAAADARSTASGRPCCGRPTPGAEAVLGRRRGRAVVVQHRRHGRTPRAASAVDRHVPPARQVRRRRAAPRGSASSGPPQPMPTAATSATPPRRRRPPCARTRTARRAPARDRPRPGSA